MDMPEKKPTIDTETDEEEFDSTEPFTGSIYDRPYDIPKLGDIKKSDIVHNCNPVPKVDKD